jgi:hypothetical protein
MQPAAAGGSLLLSATPPSTYQLVSGFPPYSTVISTGGKKIGMAAEARSARTSAPIDWNLAYVRGVKNAVSLRQMHALLARFRPEVLVIETFERRTGQRASRVAKLCHAVADLARGFSVEVCVLRDCDWNARNGGEQILQ